MNKLTQRRESDGVLRRRRAARDADRRVRYRLQVLLLHHCFPPRFGTNQRADHGHDHQSKPDGQDEYRHQIAEECLEHTAATQTKAAVDASTKAMPALLSNTEAYLPPKKDVGLSPLIFGSLNAEVTQGLQHLICCSSFNSRAPRLSFILM